MDLPLLIDKPLGATPLKALELLRRAISIPESVKLAYAGRLDPMASGLIPVLRGEQLQHQEDYWHLSKRYESTVLIGIRTDSHDVLGMPERFPMETPNAERITAVVRGLVGKVYLPVPVFSSHRHEGKPLFAWAREGGDGPPVVPVKRMSIAQIDVHGTEVIDADALHRILKQRISLVEGDFRQHDILKAWAQLLGSGGQWATVSLGIRCGGGTYVRSLAHEIGRRLGGAAMVLDLRRTHVGPWGVADPTVVRLSSPQSAP